MVHNLFDEYRFFPNYPDPELDTTAALFGALLHHQLLTNITLGMALRHVLQVGAAAC
jgi:CCR4-NOT transcription complex subunit 1